MKLKILFLIIIIFVGTYVIIVAKSSSMIMHYYHLIFTSDDMNIYNPILCEDFNFSEKGFIKRYKPHFKLVELYKISIVDENERIPYNYEFDGMVKIDFIVEGNLIYSETVTEFSIRRYILKENMQFIKSVILFDFCVPFKGSSKDNLEIQLTVIEPDKRIMSYSDKIKLCFSVSGTI